MFVDSHSSTTSHKAPKLSCQHIWKVFGKGAEEFLRDPKTTSHAADLLKAGLIGAVRNVSLDVYEGEIFIIMGLSGCGKSTLVRCLSRLIEPTAGEVMFNGQNLLQTSDKDLIDIRRHKMGMVFQHFALLPHLTVLGNIAFPLEVQGVERKIREKRAMEVVELVGLTGREGYYPRELSGGQQQRVGIARSLAVEPEIWFLDEPFSALDPLIRREMQDEFLRLQNVLHKTIVFITHDFEEAIRLADRIAIMQDGEIIQVGTPEELVLRPETEYVSEFTRGIPRAKVLTARAVMEPSQEGDFAGKVDVSVKLQELAARIIDAQKPFAVVDEKGNTIGQVRKDSVLNVLIDQE